MEGFHRMTKSSRILVTGGAGFIGSEFVRQAVAQGFKVFIVDALTYAGDLERLKALKGKFGFLKADINDVKKITAAIKKFKPWTVVNFAAETHVDRSILDGREVVRTNVVGTQNLIEMARSCGIERFVHVSTDEVYGEIETGHFYETTPLNPSSPYSAAKAAADLLIKSYARTYQFPAILVRPSNNYGPWQYPEKFVPVIIYKALKNQKILGKPKSLIEYVKDRPGHDMRYALNFDKIRRELGWAPQVNFQEGMTRTAEHYKSNVKWLNKKVSYLQSYWKKVYKK